MRKLRLLCLFCVFGVLVFCGNAFAADPAILASLQAKHAVVQVDDATLADAKGANYQIRWKRFQFPTTFGTTPEAITRLGGQALAII